MRPTAAEVLCGLHNEGVAHITELPLICFSLQPPRPASCETDLGAPVNSQRILCLDNEALRLLTTMNMTFPSNRHSKKPK